MPAPTFVAEYETASWTTTSASKTASPTTGAGDVFVVAGAVADNDNTINTPTGNSHTYTLRQASTTAGDQTYVALWTTTATAGSWTLTCTRAGGSANQWGFTSLRFSGSGGVGNSAVTNGSGAPSLNITTTQANSSIVVIVSDWVPVNGSSRTWRTVNGITPTAGNGFERVYVFSSGQYTTYVAYYPDAGAAGVKTVGLTAPTGQTYSIAAVEILGTVGGQNLSSTVTDSVSLDDTSARTLQVVRGLSESVDTPDTVNRSAAATRTAAESVIVVDSVGKTSTLVRSVSDAIDALDSFGTVIDLVSEVIDQIDSDDAVATQSDTIRILIDALVGDDITEVDDGSVGGEHSIFGTDPYPSTLGLFTDGTPNILLGNAFYTFTEATAGWRCVGARLYIPEGVVQTDPVPVGFWPYAGAGDGPDLTIAPSRSATIEDPVEGWNEVRWTPIEVAPGVPFWIAYDLGDGRYLANTGLTLDPIQAADSALVYLSEGNMSGVGSRAYFRIGTGSTSAGGSTGYGVDLIVDEGSSGGEELLETLTDTAPISDSVTAHLDMGQAFTDTIAATDTIAGQADVLTEIIDAVIASDAMTGQIDFLVGITDTIAVDDAVAVLGGNNVDLIDTVSVVDDNSSQTVSFTTDVADLLNVDDSLTSTGDFIVDIENPVPVADALVVDETGEQAIVDSAQITDLVELTGTITLELTDSVQVNDTSQRGTDHVRSATSTIGVVDVATPSDQPSVTVTDTIGISDDNTSQSVHFVVDMEDVVGTEDAVTVQGSITLDLIDDVTVVDSRQVIFVPAEGPDYTGFTAQVLPSRWSAHLVRRSWTARINL